MLVALSQHMKLWQDLIPDPAIRAPAFEVLKIFARLVILSTDPDVTVAVATVSVFILNLIK